MLSLVMVLFATTPGSVEAMGRVVVTEGTAEVRSLDAETWAPLDKGATLNTGDTIKTGADGRLRILMANRSVVDLGASSEMRLRFIVGPPKQRRVGLRAILGRLWARVARGAGEDRFEVETDNAVAGVRGTSFFMDVGAEGDTAVTVAAGSVEMASADIEPFTLTAMQRGVLRRGANPLIERGLSLQRLAGLRRSIEPRHRLGSKMAGRRLAKLQSRIQSNVGLRKMLSGAKGKAMRQRLRRAGFRRLPLNIDPAIARRLLERFRRRQAP